jgi:hypothetical protein
MLLLVLMLVVLVLVLVLVAPITDWRKYPYRRRQSAYQ